MKITFENYESKQNVDKVKTVYSSRENNQINSTRGYALDISGTVMDNTAYGVQGRTTEDIMQQAEYMDVTTQRNYMTVMSNSMSSEDFAKLQEEGYHPGNTTIEETVTITDHIKAELAKAGVDVAGYTDNVSDAAMKEVAGSQASAQQIVSKLKQADAAVTEDTIEQAEEAYEKARMLEKLTEGAVKYLVENGMEPTIENLYRAQFSGNADPNKQGRGYYAEGTAGYYSMKAEDYNWKNLNSQMKAIIEESGLTFNEKSLEQAKWLIEKGIPLTTDNLINLSNIEGLELPMDADKLLTAIATTVGSGKSAQQTNLADPETNIEKAIRYVELAENISEAAVDCVVAEQKKLNLRNLEEAQKRIDSGEKVMADFDISARRKMEEVRLQMTVEANLKLLESGYQIDTAELEQLVEDLKAAENAAKQQFFKTADAEDAQIKATLYEETKNKVSQIPYLPAAVVGKAAFDENATLDSIHAQGTELKRTYEAVGESYETMMTAPRADLGDSIKKAFRNVDDILKHLDLELSEQNRRAVRILGYNSMEITAENILSVKDADLSIKKAVDRMTPATTLEMIREGVNPLEMTVSELNEYFNQRGDEAEREVEKYSKYLYKLEQHNEISESERDAYIGIYRFFRQMEKTDGAAIGAVLNAGGELSFKNLLTAIRSGKKTGMDISVHDSFGGLMNLVSGSDSITDQIAKGFNSQVESGNGQQEYYKKVTEQIMDNLEPEKLKDITITKEMTLEEFANHLETADTNQELETAYREAQLKEFREAQNVEDKTLKFLLDTGEEITVNNLLAADKWVKKPGEAFEKMNRFGKQFEKATAKLIENFKDEVSAKQGYEEFAEEVSDELNKVAESEDATAVDLKEVRLLHKQIHLARANARQEDYQIPVQIGEEITSVRLRVIRGTGESGKVKVTMETEKYGLAEAEFKVSGREVEGFIAVNKDGMTQELNGMENRMRKVLQDSDLEITAFHFVQSKHLKTDSFMKEEQISQEKVSSAQLYNTAKAFLQAISE
ncbi:MAG: hypothetical protein IJN54_10930 [Lachnospiraceae bacterium]|nr:hypothetical protein [Lachnospiraceae bacterium]